MEELKPCPFCGGEAYFNEGFSFLEYGYVCCNECGAATAWTAKNRAIAKWNTRAERTCTPVYQYSGEAFPHSIHVTELSCGHEFRWYERGYTPNYCPNCGAKVVS